MSVEATSEQQAEFVEVLDAEQDEKTSQATLLVNFTLARAEVFHDANGDTYARIHDSGEVRRLDTRGFRDWLMAGFYRAEGKSARDQSVREAIGTLSGIGRYQGEQRDVYVRCAFHDSAYYVDLAVAGDNRAIRVTPGAWEIVANPPVMFVRPESTRPLPVPVRRLHDGTAQMSGGINKLFQYVNVPHDHRLLVITWLIDAIRTNTPFPVLELIGEAGSAKSTTQRVLRRLIDPNGCELRAMPKCVEDIFVGAGVTHVYSMENISHLPAPMQDALCTLATGGGFARRKLYTDSDESIINVKRPVMLNGISVAVTAQDLVDRTISIDLPLISERVEADALLDQFDCDHAAILGDLLDTFAAALERLRLVDLPADQRPRLIEFAKLGCAVAEVMGRPSEDFLAEFTSSRSDAIHRTIDASPAAAALVEMFDASGRKTIELPLKEMLNRLDGFRPTGAESWPKSARGLGDVLRRAAPALRQIGIDVRRVGKSVGNIVWRVSNQGNQPGQRPQHPQHPQTGDDLGTLGTLGMSRPQVSLGNAEVF